MAVLRRVIAWSTFPAGASTTTVLLCATLDCGHPRTDEVAAGLPIHVMPEVPCPRCDVVSSDGHNYFYPEDCEHPQCRRRIVDAMNAEAQRQNAAPPAASNDSA